MTVDDNSLRLDGSWAVITGASKGIGFGIAERFVDAGANVMLVARGADDLARAADELEGAAEKNGREVLTHVADASRPESLDELFDRIDAEVPDLNTYVANARSGSPIPSLAGSPAQRGTILSLTLTGTRDARRRAPQRLSRTPPPTRAVPPG